MRVDILLAPLCALLLLGPGCYGGGFIPDLECPPQGTALTWEEFGEPFMKTWCLECHSGTRHGAAREQAPVGVDYDTLEQVRLHATDIASRLYDMPPGARPRPSVEEHARVREWLGCGAP